MLIPEEILHSQVCYECKGYLTVLPVKVYLNRHVKCGRCVKEDDNGVISHLYGDVIKNFEFPCINRLEGCSKIMNINEVKSHEEDCKAERHACPFCSEFIDSAHKLYLHLKNTHQKHGLTNMEVFVDLDQGNIKNTTWIFKKGMLLIIFLNYNNFDEQLFLNINIIGEVNRQYTTQNFILKALNNDIKYKTRSLPCLSWGKTSLEGFTIPINVKDFPKNVVVCKFEVKSLAINMPVVNDLLLTDHFAKTVKHAKGNCVFKNITTLESEKNVFSDFLFCVNNLKWRLCIKKYGVKLGVYLNSTSPEKTTIAKLYFKITLKSRNVEKYIYNQGTKINEVWEKNQSFGWPNFISWGDLVNKDNAYIENDSIEFEVEIKYKEQAKEKTICTTCCEKCKQRKPDSNMCKEHNKESSSENSD